MVRFFRERIDRQSVELGGFATIKAFTLLPREFSQGEGVITPTQKIRRKVIAQHFAPEIAAMYPEDWRLTENVNRSLLTWRHRSLMYRYG